MSLFLLPCTSSFDKKKKEVIQGSKFFLVIADTVTTIDNGTWVSMTMYYVADFSRESFMYQLEHIEEGATYNNLTKIITHVVCDISRMLRVNISNRMLAFGVGQNPCLICF